MSVLEETDDRWETWGIAARWDPRHGWHNPDDPITDDA